MSPNKGETAVNNWGDAVQNPSLIGRVTVPQTAQHRYHAALWFGVILPVINLTQEHHAKVQ